MTERKNLFNLENEKELDIAWCPGCGNFGILNTLKKALEEMEEITPQNLVLVSGIGQAAKIPHYFKNNTFNGLHGRALPAAVAIKIANPELYVIAESGDGDMYGEGGNHFIHNIRRNVDITNIVHDNRVYGLTKGQASPTSQKGMVTPVQVNGVILNPFNPIAVAIANGATFVARTFVGDIQGTKEIIKKAIRHKGYALVDLFQPCVTFNRINTYEWFKEHTYKLNEDYDPSNKLKALEIAFQEDKLALGVIYEEQGKPTFEEQLYIYKENKEPLYKRSIDLNKLESFINSMR
ncbi:thiamine pyrophosphate-dependent enzyme [Petrotoga sp. 9PWA.NaAc.5.4]|uniref:thiamine pyrophosphate-dependent enzyme n=1 Tax=Petrotoga sp. 9PWA.NaAc.5.4 TaxID=1434328 RepID=UPI000CB29C6F|nr:thiamine pyrophosphate-dependent enzyme [Petrotoga sp. 9PWA.NaAc.5.4]PNR95332.1 2-oxoacid ferredoxin oxidoreductase subunit beta [Petrotoga sp. 9PWA.NaAc.5.4]